MGIDLGRIDTSKPVDMAALCASKAMFVKPEKNQFGFNLTHDEGLDAFSAKVNLEVQWASEQAIMAVERAGGRITTGYLTCTQSSLSGTHSSSSNQVHQSHEDW